MISESNMNWLRGLVARCGADELHDAIAEIGGRPGHIDRFRAAYIRMTPEEARRAAEEFKAVFPAAKDFFENTDDGKPDDAMIEFKLSDEGRAILNQILSAVTSIAESVAKIANPVILGAVSSIAESVAKITSPPVHGWTAGEWKSDPIGAPMKINPASMTGGRRLHDRPVPDDGAVRRKGRRRTDALGAIFAAVLLFSTTVQAAEYAVVCPPSLTYCVRKPVQERMTENDRRDTAERLLEWQERTCRTANIDTCLDVSSQVGDALRRLNR